MRLHLSGKTGLTSLVFFTLIFWPALSGRTPAFAKPAASVPSIDEIKSEPADDSVPKYMLKKPDLFAKPKARIDAGMPRWIDMDDPAKALYMPEKDFNGMRQFDFKSLWVLLLPGKKNFLGSMDEKSTALYSYPGCKKLKTYPQLPIGGLGACDSTGNLVALVR